MNPSNESDEPLVPEDAQLATRRRFLARLSVTVGALASALAAAPIVWNWLAPAFRKPSRVWRSVGPAHKWRVGETALVKLRLPEDADWGGPITEVAAWLRREGEEDFVALAVNCSHLGCPVRWEAGARLFLCPCHGGVYYQDGTVAAGPPPRALTRYQVRVRKGNVELLTMPLPIT
jgi:menaquinol-cytochrome c reductase iron-sulfur subunit